jgi:hypothetical protein
VRLDLPVLTEKAKVGEITPSEVADVAEELKRRAVTDERDDLSVLHLVYILGRTGAVQHRGLVERFFTYPRFPAVSALVIQILCMQWGVGSRSTSQDSWTLCEVLMLGRASLPV